MATRGWSGVSPAAFTAQPAKRPRLTGNAAVLAEQDRRRESELQAEVERFLENLRRQGGIGDWYHARKPQRDRPGMLDLCVGIREGLVVALELKRPDHTGRLRPEQERWMRWWGERGVLAEGLDEVREFLRRWGVVC